MAKSTWVGVIPLLLIWAADAFFLDTVPDPELAGPDRYRMFLVLGGIAVVAALALIPSVVVRVVVAVLLLVAALAASMTIGILYFPAVAAAAFAAWYESRARRRLAQQVQ